MTPIQSLFERPFILLGADTATVNDAANTVQLIREPFTPSAALTNVDVVVANFDGAAALVVGAAPGLESIDPNTGDVILDIQPPIGGWRWETGDVDNLPQTIYGFIYNNGDGDLIASELLLEPVTLDGVNQTVILERVALRLPVGSIT